MSALQLLLIVVLLTFLIIYFVCTSKLPIAAKTAILAITLSAFAWYLGVAISDRLDIGIISAFFTMLIVTCSGVIVAKLNKLHK